MHSEACELQSRFPSAWKAAQLEQVIWAACCVNSALLSYRDPTTQ